MAIGIHSRTVGEGFAMNDEIESSEVWLRDGETWFADPKALCARLGAEYISQVEGGDIYVGICGKGEVALSNLLAEEGTAPRKSASVTAIK